MNTITERQRVILLKRNEAQMTDLFQQLVTYVQGLLARNSGAQGAIPPEKAAQIRAAAGLEVQRLFLGSAAPDGSLTPYQIRNGEVIPDSPYMRVLWAGVNDMAQAAVTQQALVMGRSLKNHPDIIKALLAARKNPFLEQPKKVKEGYDSKGKYTFRPNPLAQYDPLHLWLDPQNRTLSDRIWNATGETRRKLDLFLDAEIRAGKGSREIAADLEAFLLPGRSLIRTNMPYGTDASYDAMRLARTELASAFNRASSAAGQLNPFVETYNVVTSPAHACCDECDDEELGGPYDKADTEHLPPFHPHCLLPGTVVNVPGNILAATKTLYVGRCIKIQLANGLSLSVTPNHPILTSEGWVKAEFLNHSHKIAVAANGQRIALRVNPNNHYMPTLIEDVFSSLEEAQGVPARRMPAASVDFHGDARYFKSDVNIVYANRPLLDHVKVDAQALRQVGFDRRDTDLPDFYSNGFPEFGISTHGPAALGSMSSLRHSHALFGAHLQILERLAFLQTANRDVVGNEQIADAAACDFQITRQFLDRFPSEITYYNILSIESFDYSGHVYDLQSDPYELYISNGIITHNCMCTVRWNKSANTRAIITAFQERIAAIPGSAGRTPLSDILFDIAEEGEGNEAIEVIGPLLVKSFVKLFLNTDRVYRGRAA